MLERVKIPSLVLGPSAGDRDSAPTWVKG